MIPIEPAMHQRYTDRMSPDVIQAYEIKISTLLAERLRVRGSLEQQAYKAGPKLPRRVRKAMKRLVADGKNAGNPKLWRQIDTKRLSFDGDLVIEHLETIDPWDRFKGRVILWLSGVSFLLILGFIVWVVIANQRGWI